MLASHVISFDEEQIEFIHTEFDKVLRSGKVILGEYTERFEREYAAKCNRTYGIAVSSDTAAFEMQLKTLGVEGQLVIFPALGFPSILESIKNAGAEPLFIDCDMAHHLFAHEDIVEQTIVECIKRRGVVPAALILMHTGGLLAARSKEIEAVCHRYNVTVIEDAAHAFGARLNGAPAGSFGHSSAFSLYATKPMHTMEGGMIVTDSAYLHNEAKIYRNYGRTQDFGRSVIVRHGYSWRMTEVQAIVGLANLMKIDENVKKRQRILDNYYKLWRDTGGSRFGYRPLNIQPGMEPCGYRCIQLLDVFHQGKLRHDPGMPFDKVNRKYYEFRMDLKQRVREKGFDLPGEVYELPAHKQPIWIEHSGESYPQSESFCARHFSFPVYPGLTESDQEQIVRTVNETLWEMVNT